MNRRLPPLAIGLGAAGLIPFLGCGVAAFAGDPAQSRFWLATLIAYGSVILSFLGGVHWGFALDGEAGRPQTQRLLFGVMPPMVGWGALVIAIWAAPAIGLGILIAGYIGTVAMEAQGRRAGMVPAGYMWLRWGLSAVVVALLTTALVLDLAGARINW